MGHVDAPCHEERKIVETAATVESGGPNTKNEKLNRCQLVAAIDYEDPDLHLQATQNRDADIVALRNRLEIEEVDDFGVPEEPKRRATVICPC